MPKVEHQLHRANGLGHATGSHRGAGYMGWLAESLLRRLRADFTIRAFALPRDGLATGGSRGAQARSIVRLKSFSRQ